MKSDVTKFDTAVQRWEEKLAYLESEFAVTSDPVQKFEVKKRIEECTQEIERLKRGKLQDEPADKDGTESNPSQFFVPIDQQRLILGRADVLEKLRDTLIQQGRQAIVGVSGVGKTQVAVQYAYRYKSCYDSIFWASAGTIDAL